VTVFGEPFLRGCESRVVRPRRDGNRLHCEVAVGLEQFLVAGRERPNRPKFRWWFTLTQVATALVVALPRAVCGRPQIAKGNVGSRHGPSGRTFV
jgi:hypothetical protein